MKHIFLFLFCLYAIAGFASDITMGVSGASDVTLGTGNSDIVQHEVFEFSNIAATTSNLKLDKTGTNAWVEWGDGKIEQVSKTEYTSHTYASAFTGNVRIWSDDGNPITAFYSSDNKYSFDIADLTASLPNLTYIAIYGYNTLFGDIANAPVNLTTITIYGYNTLFGDIANAPVNLTTITIYGYNTLSGNIANAPVNLTYIQITGSNTLSGDIANAPVNLTYIQITGSNTISAYTAGRTWANNQRYIYLAPFAGSGLDATEVDNLLIDLAVVASWTTEKVVWLAGNNAARTAASDAAVATLIGKGVSVTVNE